MADSAISFEAPEVDLSTGADGGAELDAGGEGAAAEGAGEGEAPAEGDGEAAPGKPFLAVDDGKLTKVAKETIEKLKAENPQLAKAVQRALFAEDRLRRELPGGFKDLANLRATVEQLGGDEGIQGLQGELNGFREFDGLLTAGKPEALDFFLKNPDGTPSEVGQQALIKLAPAIFDRFQTLHPEGFNAFISQTFLADMREQELPMTIRLLGSILERATLTEPDKAEVSKLYAALTGYVNRISAFASKQVTPPTPTAKSGADDPRAAELDTREQAIRRAEWGTETGKQHASIFSAAWKRLATAVPKEKVDLVRRLYGIHLQEKLKAKTDFDVKMGRFFQAKQKDGFLKTHASAFQDAVPLALRSAMAEAGIGARKAPIVPGKEAQPNSQAYAFRQAKPAVGFTPVAAKPNMADVDNRTGYTSPTMWQNNQAILKNGKRVTWQ